jgi:hypothetical protein
MKITQLNLINFILKYDFVKKPSENKELVRTKRH